MISTLYQAFLAHSYAFDTEVIKLVQSIGPAWLPVAKFLSHGVGSYPIMVAVFFVALFLIDKRRVALEVLVIAIAAFAILTASKHLFHVDRPYIIDPRADSHCRRATRSCPSSFSAGSPAGIPRAAS